MTETYQCPECKRLYKKEMPCPYCYGVMTISAEAKDTIKHLSNSLKIAERRIKELEAENKRLKNNALTTLGNISDLPNNIVDPVFSLCTLAFWQKGRIEELERPLKSSNFDVDGVLAVGQELINKDKRIKELEQALKEQ